MKYEPPDYRQLYEEEKAKTAKLQEAVTAMATTLRDQFAMAALTGFIACPSNFGDATRICRLSYEFADAMLQAREKK